MTNAHEPMLYTDEVETIPADEADEIQRVIQALELILRSQVKSGQFARTCMSKPMVTPMGNSGYCRTCPKNLRRGYLSMTASTGRWFGC